MRILIDLDGVCYDFAGSVRQFLVEHRGYTPEQCPPAETWRFYETWGLSGKEFAEVCAEGVRAGVIYAGEPVLGAVSAISELHEAGHEIHLVTARSFCEADEPVTRTWLEEWGIPYTSLTFSHDKTVVEVDVAIEDNAENFLALQGRGVTAYLMDQAWNRHVETPFRVGSWEKFVGKVRALAAMESGLDDLRLPFVVGVAGYAGSGKDTLGSILVDEYGYERLSFADPLRDALAALNPIVGYHGAAGLPVRYTEAIERYGYAEAKSRFPEVRELLQRMGTEVGRNLFGENFWVQRALDRMEDGKRYVLTDVRFPNEADAVVSRGGLLVRVNRPGYEPVNAHPSETAVDDAAYDLVLENDGTLEDFRNLVHSHERLFHRA